MKMSSKLEAIGNTAFNPMEIDRDNPEVMAKLAGILTTSNYGFPYSAIRELWLNARENEQDTIEFDGYAPEKTVITLPSRSAYRLWQQAGMNHQDGTIFGELESADNDDKRPADFVYGEQDWFVSVEPGSHEFSIRNYGRSMDSETARQRITGVGTSSKSEDNTRGGGMGIGIQSPLSITDMALFENFHNGTVTYLTIMRDENDAVGYGEPYTADTDEPDGMRVSFIINDGVRLSSIIDDIVQTFLLAGKSERLEVHADSETVSTFQRRCGEFVWIDDERHYGWNFAIQRGRVMPTSDFLMVDGCMYRHSDAAKFHKLKLKDVVSVSGQVLGLVAVYNARVGEFKVTGSREYVRDFDKTLAYEDLPKEVQDVEEVFANAIADNSDEEKSLIAVYAEAVQNIVDQLDNIDSGVAHTLSDIVRTNGVRKLNLARQIDDISDIPVKLTNGEQSSVHFLGASHWEHALFLNPNFISGDPETFVAVRGEESKLSMNNIRSRMVRMKDIASTYSQVVDHMKNTMDISSNPNVIELLRNIAHADAHSVKNTPDRYAVKVKSTYKDESYALADGAEITTLDVVEYPEIDATIKNIRNAWKDCGFAPDRANVVRNEARYEVLFYNGEESPFEDMYSAPLSVSDLVELLEENDAEQEDKRIVVLEGDSYGIRTRNTVRDQRLSRYLFNEYGYSVYVFVSKRSQKIGTMADRLGKVWPETYYVSEDELYDRAEYAASALSELENMESKNDSELLDSRESLENIAVAVSEIDDEDLRNRWRIVSRQLNIMDAINNMKYSVDYRVNSVADECADVREEIAALSKENENLTMMTESAETLDEIATKFDELKALFAKLHE